MPHHQIALHLQQLVLLRHHDLLQHLVLLSVVLDPISNPFSPDNTRRPLQLHQRKCLTRLIISSVDQHVKCPYLVHQLLPFVCFDWDQWKYYLYVC